MLREDKKVQDNMNYKLDKDEMQKSNGIRMAKYEPGISYKDLQELPGDTLQEKIERKMGIKVMPNISMEEAIKLLKSGQKPADK